MLARRYRFHGHGSLTYLFKHGQTVRGHFLLLRCIKNERRPHGRVAVIVSKKIAKSAVIRNRVRRRVFEVIRLHKPHIAGGYDLAFIAISKDLTTTESYELNKDIEMILKRARIWHDT